MREPILKKATLEQLRRSKEAGQLLHDPAAPPGDSLGAKFWRDALTETLPPTKHSLKEDKPLPQEPNRLDL